MCMLDLVFLVVANVGGGKLDDVETLGGVWGQHQRTCYYIIMNMHYSEHTEVCRGMLYPGKKGTLQL